MCNDTLKCIDLDIEKELHLRQTMLKEVGVEGQRRLKEASVLIVGVGGLGSVVAAYLNGSGIGKIGLIDSDTVSFSNLHRQLLYTLTQVGMSKAERAADFLRERSGNPDIVPYREALTPGNAEHIIKDYDLVIDCTDNYSTRFLIDDTCRKLNKTWVFGAIGEFRGCVSVFAAGSGRCLSDIYPDREYLCNLTPTVSGVLGPVAGIVASMQALEAIKLIIGIESPLTGKLFTINTLNLETNLIDF